jgi:hypothetical protein
MRHLPLILIMSVATTAHAEDWLYLTNPGDTLISIGQQYLKNPNDWPKVQQANQLKNPRFLPTNTRIKLPVVLLKQTPAQATVTHAKGNARIKPADGPFRKLEVGDTLTGGETVITGPNSFATIRLADGSVLNQQPSSKLSFGRLAAYGKTGMVSTELNLESGRLEANASKQLAPAGGFKVATPVAVAGLRGTAFRLNMAEDGKALRGEVLEGAVGLAAQGQEVGVEAGQGTVAEQGKPPAPPRALRPKPNLDGLPTRLDSLPIRFAWNPVMAANAWRAQVARDADFHDIVLDDLFTAPQATWQTDLPDGRYVLRVRGVDADGLEGLDRDHPFELDARPLPPQAVAPASGSRAYSQQVELTWAAAAEAQGYLLQLSPSAGFDRDVRELKLDAVTRHPATLPPGDWHWRLASLDDQGQRHSWGEAGHFRVQPLPTAPQVESRAEVGQAHFAWSVLPGASRYEFELGADAVLATPMERRQAEDTRLALALAPGKYWWRVRGLEADGQAGAWSGASPVILPPPPPQLRSHAEHERVRGLSARLAWDAVPGVQGYHLQMDKDPSFAAPQVNTQVAGTEHPVQVGDAGQYHWRVAALGADQLEGPFSAPRGLLFQPPPATPANVQAREDNNRLFVTWQGEATRYQVDMARDQAFTQDVLRFDTDLPEQRLIMPQPGQYWLRVMAYDKDNVPSAPSAPLPVEIKQPFPWWLLPLLLVIP